MTTPKFDLHELKEDHNKLLQAIREKNRKLMVSLLGKYNYDSRFINHRAGEGKITALHVAYNCNDLRTAAQLTSIGADETIQDALNRPPQSYASTHKSNHDPRLFSQKTPTPSSLKVVETNLPQPNDSEEPSPWSLCTIS